MRYRTFQEVVAKYALSLGLDEQAPLTDWEAALASAWAAKREALATARNPSLKHKAEREGEELQAAAQMVSQLSLFARLRRCLQEDKQETFEWELRKPGSQAALPSEEDSLYGEYLDLKGEAKKKWPTVTFPVKAAAPPALAMPKPEPSPLASSVPPSPIPAPLAIPTPAEPPARAFDPHGGAEPGPRPATPNLASAPSTSAPELAKGSTNEGASTSVPAAPKLEAAHKTAALALPTDEAVLVTSELAAADKPGAGQSKALPIVIAAVLLVAAALGLAFYLHHHGANRPAGAARSSAPPTASANVSKPPAAPGQPQAAMTTAETSVPVDPARANPPTAASTSAEPKLARLEITSAPDGASIIIDGQEQSATTPARFKMPAGTYRIGLSLKGYLETNTVVTLKAEDELGLAFGNLGRGQSLLTVLAEPIGARVFIDGIIQGRKTPARELPIEAGDHEVKVKLDGYQWGVRRVTVEPGRATTTDFGRLTPESR